MATDKELCVSIYGVDIIDNIEESRAQQAKDQAALEALELQPPSPPPEVKSDRHQ